MRRWIPTFDAVVAFGCRDALAGVAEFDVALQVEPAGGRIGIAFHHHRTVAVSGKVKMDIAVHILFFHVFKTHDRFGGAAHHAIVGIWQQAPDAKTGGGDKRQSGKGEKVRGASFIAASVSSKSSYRNS